MNGHLGGTQNTLHIIALSRLAPPAKILDMVQGREKPWGCCGIWATTPGA